jgi:N-formylglutamate amidohydrolase
VDYNRYFEIERGNVPVVLSCPHGGYLKPRFISDKKIGVNIADKVTYLTVEEILKQLNKRNIKITYILSKIHRSKIDLNRPPLATNALNQNAKNVKLVREIHGKYHKEIQKLTTECISRFKKCFFIDFHGFTKPHSDYPDIIIGHIFGNTLNLKMNKNETNTIENQSFWGFSQILKELSKDFTLDNGLGLSDFNLAYSGGYITHQFYKKKHINAIQLEIAKYIRKNPTLLRIFISDFVEAIDKTINSEAWVYEDINEFQT